MTAEVAVMNAQAVALAADSAVSINGTSKSFTSADKIFGLGHSAGEPIAAMVYGNAEFMGIPWETVLKAFRGELIGRGLPTVKAYAEEFAQFVKRDNQQLFPRAVRKKQARIEIRSRLQSIRDLIEGCFEVCISQQGHVTESRVEIYVAAAIHATHLLWSSAPLVHGLSDEEVAAVIEQYREDAAAVQEEIFLDYPLTDDARAQLSDLCGWFLTKLREGEEVPHSSGVVFAGFGSKENFPHLVELGFHGIVGNVLRYECRNTFDISRSRPAEVVAFGQRDMVKTFMDGIDPAFKDEISISLKAFLVGYSDVILDSIPEIDPAQRQARKQRFVQIGQEAFARYRESMKEWRRRDSSKTLSVIRALPKDELATVAESLVSLTSLKRRVSMDSSVSPPIDVCVISKHDGCVWVKKKHYFPSELNPRFYERYRDPRGREREDEYVRRKRISDTPGDPDTFLQGETGEDPDGGPGADG